MADHANAEAVACQTPQHDAHQGSISAPSFSAALSPVTGPPLARVHFSGLQFSDARLRGRGNGPSRAALLQSLQRTHGNRSIQRSLHRGTLVPVQRADYDTPVTLGGGSATPAPAVDPLTAGGLAGTLKWDALPSANNPPISAEGEPPGATLREIYNRHLQAELKRRLGSEPEIKAADASKGLQASDVQSAMAHEREIAAQKHQGADTYARRLEEARKQAKSAAQMVPTAPASLLGKSKDETDDQALQLALKSAFPEIQPADPAKGLTEEDVQRAIEDLKKDEEAAGKKEQAWKDQLLLAQQQALLDTLKVEQSGHYQPQTDAEGNKKTFCNVYAYDWVIARGGYLPLTWWKEPLDTLLRDSPGLIEAVSKADYDAASPAERKKPPLTSLTKEERDNPPHPRKVPPIYNETVRDLTANELSKWMSDWGPSYGWEALLGGAAEAQKEANEGHLVVIIGSNTVEGGHGHITVVLKESTGGGTPGESAAPKKEPDTHGTSAEGNEVPLQSQAGGSNFSSGYLKDAGGKPKEWWNEGGSGAAGGAGNDSDPIDVSSGKKVSGGHFWVLREEANPKKTGVVVPPADLGLTHSP